MVSDSGMNLGKMLRQQRVMMTLKLGELAEMAGISPSHLGRIERGERFPSASVLRRLTKPLSFEESELFSIAGYLSYPLAGIDGENKNANNSRQLDPYVRVVLSQEPVEVQRALTGILSILKSIARVSKGG